MIKTRIVLASTSPRRIDLLKQAGLFAQKVAPECDETPRRGESPRTLVRRLARAKAESVARSLAQPPRTRTLVIAADTIVVEPSGRRILGKPRDAREARSMLKMICGKTHVVLTGFCVVECSGPSLKASIHVVSTRVTMLSRSPKQIRDYVESGEPMDKAGAYAAQGLGMNFISEIRGSYTNVVGLPMAQLLRVLEREFGL